MEIKPDGLRQAFEVNTMALLQLARLATADMTAKGAGTILCTGNTSAYRGRSRFAGFAPSKAAQRILIESIAREAGPKGIHAAYIAIDAVIDVPWARERFSEQPDEFFCQPADIAEECYRIAHQPRSAWSSESVIRPPWRNLVSDMTGPTLRIFSYLPNPRVWKSLIAAEYCEVDVEVRGAAPANLATWLWDFDARELTEDEMTDDSPHFRTARRGFKGGLYKTDAFLAAHPFGTVPAAFDPEGDIGVFESNSILSGGCPRSHRNAATLRNFVLRSLPYRQFP